jgi:histidinol dehydrogenase
MRILQGKAAEVYVRSLERRASRLDELEPAMQSIVDDVRRKGDRALLKHARKLDGLGARQELRVRESELRESWKAASKELRAALKMAEKNIRQFSEWQKPKQWRRARDGAVFGQLVRPLDSAGCYVPGGRFPLVSTLLMTVIPAQVAGVKNIRVVSPRPSREVLAGAALLGVKEFYRVGGAQAIAALAYGTETIAHVDKIVGPGNLYVTTAKKLVSFDCAIDMLAGPTEGMIVSDCGEPGFIAADLLAQAEHDPETLVCLVTTSKPLAEEVSREVQNGGRARPPLSVNRIAAQAISSRGAILIARSKSEAFDWANRIAPEHITVERDSLPLVRNAGSIFVGDYSAQAAGDYASGPNHVLPTAGAARFRGGLSVMDFVKLITVQDLSSRSLSRMARSVVVLAETEGLKAHADSIRVRSASA